MKQLSEINHLNPYDMLFENLKNLLRPREVADLLDVKESTVYDWRYRPNSRKVPKEMFVKFNGKLYLRTDILKGWVASQNR
jgi:hypothetical protein